jgi:5'(3')-deoxyribonucleotidase
MKVGIDIDAVLCETVPSICKYLRKRYNIEMTKSDVTEWDFPVKGTGMNFGQVIQEAFEVPGFIESLYPVLGARTAMFTLIEESFARPDMSLMLVTSRKEKFTPQTRAWVDRYFHPDLPVWHTHDGMKNGKFDILIDDYDENILQFINSGGKYGLLFSQPWNISSQVDQTCFYRVFRTNGWLEVLNRLYTLV